MKTININTSAIDPSVDRIRSVFKQMIEDKRVMSSYIREHETLNGFSRKSICFVEPI